MSIKEQNSSSCIEINPSVTAKHSVIWLHGLGAEGNDFVPIVSELKLPESLGVRFVFPHAPIMPVTINNGYQMRAWFDIFDLSVAAKIDAAGIAASVATVEKYIAHEETLGIASSNIILAGFSQGAVIALSTGLCCHKPLAGIMALSGFLPLANQVLERATPVNKNIPIFIAHGTQDSILPYALGNTTAEALQKAHYPISWHDYPMAHSVCGEEVKDIREWIINIFK